MPHQSLSLEDLVSRLAWHNPAMPFIHTVPARSEEFLLLWCLAYDYPTGGQVLNSHRQLDSGGRLFLNFGALSATHQNKETRVASVRPLEPREPISTSSPTRHFPRNPASPTMDTRSS